MSTVTFLPLKFESRYRLNVPHWRGIGLNMCPHLQGNDGAYGSIGCADAAISGKIKIQVTISARCLRILPPTVGD